MQFSTGVSRQTGYSPQRQVQDIQKYKKQGTELSATKQLEMIRPSKSQQKYAQEKKELAQLRTENPRAYQQLSTKKSLEVQELVSRGKVKPLSHVDFTDIRTREQSSQKMSVINDSLKVLGIVDDKLKTTDSKSLKNNAAKLSSPSTWPRAIGRGLLAGIKRTLSLGASAGLAIGQYTGHLLGGIIGNGGLLLAQGVGEAANYIQTRSVKKEIAEIEAGFAGQDSQIDIEYNRRLLEIGHGDPKEIQAKTEQAEYQRDTAKMKLRLSNREYCLAKSKLEGLQRNKTIFDQNMQRAHKGIHKWLKDTSYHGSRKFDETLGLREKSTHYDKTFEYINAPEIAESAVGVVSNSRTLAQNSLKFFSHAPEVAEALGEAAAPMVLVTDGVGAISDSYSIGKTTLRLHKLDKMLDTESASIQLKTPDSVGSHETLELGEDTRESLELLRKNTSQTRKTKAVSLLKHLGMIAGVGAMLALGVATGGVGFIVAGAVGGAIYAGIMVHRAYKQDIRVENINKMEVAHTEVQKRMDMIQEAMQDKIEGTQEYMDLSDTYDQLSLIQNNIESLLRQISPQHAAQGLISDLMDVRPRLDENRQPILLDGEPSYEPTEKAKAAHHALLKGGFNFTGRSYELLHGTSTAGLQRKLQISDKDSMRLFRQELVMSLEQFTS